MIRPQLILKCSPSGLMITISSQEFHRIEVFCHEPLPVEFSPQLALSSAIEYRLSHQLLLRCATCKLAEAADRSGDILRDHILLNSLLIVGMSLLSRVQE